MPLTGCVRRIRDYIKDIGVIYDEKINKQHAKAPCLLNRKVFIKIKNWLTWNTLSKVILFFVFIIAYEF